MAYEHAVVLTGGIATGKSTASALFSMLGFRIIDADAIAREILAQETPKIAQLFGEKYLEKEGVVDRKALGKLVFENPKERERLEALLHPLIRQEIQAQSQKQESLGKPYLLDIPLFYETGDYPIEKVIVVYAPRPLQLARLIQRENLSEAEARLRIEAQLDIEEKRRLAPWVLDNSGDLKQLQKECERLKKTILQSFS